MPDIPTPDWIPEEPPFEAVDAAMAALFPAMQERFLKSKHLNGSGHWVRNAEVDDLMLELHTRKNLLRQFFDLHMYLEIVTRHPRTVTEGSRSRIIPGDEVRIDVPKGVQYASIDALTEEHRTAIAHRLVAGEWALLLHDAQNLEDNHEAADYLEEFMALAAADLHRILLEIRRGELLQGAKARRLPTD